MGTIIIKSDNIDDLYFINELARRLGLNSNIEIEITEDKSIGRIKKIDSSTDDDKSLAKMISRTGLTNIGKILKDDPGGIF